MVRQLNTTALPALKAAVVAYNHTQQQRKTFSFTQTLHTFGGCTYTLTFTNVAAEGEFSNKASPAASVKQLSSSSERSSRSSSSSSSSDTADKDAGGRTLTPSVNQYNEAAETCIDDGGILCSAAIHVTFTHALAFADLNTFNNCTEYLAERLSSVAPHCSVTSTPPPSSNRKENGNLLGTRFQLTIPVTVAAKERDRALSWAAEWRVLSLLPVLSGFLRRCQAAEERQTLTLVPQVANSHSRNSLTAQSLEITLSAPDLTGPSVETSDMHLTQVLVFCATPLPSSSSSPAASASATDAATSVTFDGAISLTTCITSRDTQEALFIRCYLAAFAEADKTPYPILLTVHEALQPPPELASSVLQSVVGLSALSATNPPPYVWWCTMMLGPHQAKRAGALEKLVSLSLRLRETILFHVHQENTSLHTLLRHQLDSYVARF